MLRNKPGRSKDATGVAMLVGLMLLIGIVGLVFTVATKDCTLVKKVLFCWLVSVMFLALLATYLFKGEVLIPRSKMMLPLAVYVCLSVVWVALSRYRYASAQELVWLVCCGMLLFVTVRAVTSERALLLVAGMLAAVAALSCLYGILQHYGVDPAFGDDVLGFEAQRSFSAMGHPNFFASFLVLAMPVFLSLFYSSESRLAKGLLLPLICAVLLSLFYTESRGAWLGYLGALPLWFFFSLSSKKWRLIFLGPMLAVAGGMLLLLLLEGARGYVIVWALPFWLAAVLVLQLAGRGRKLRFPTKPTWGALLLAAVVLVSNLFVNYKRIGGRMETTFEAEKGSVRTRRIIWAATLKMLMARPVFGWGPGAFGIYFPRFRDPSTAAKIAPNTLHAHCEYLETAAETGLVGLAVFLWMLTAFVRESVRRIAQAREGLQTMAIVGLLAGCTAILLQGAVSVTTRWVVGRFFLWVGIGLAIAAGRMSAPVGAGRKSGKKKRTSSQQPESFYRVAIKPIRGLARAVFILFAIGVAALAGWWGGRVLKSAVLTTKAERYLVGTDRLAEKGLKAAGILETLRQKKGLRETAIELYEGASELNPYNLTAYYKLGHCYNLQGKFENSLRTYRRMAALSPDGSDIHFNLGVVYANMRRWEDSRAELETALSMKVGLLTRLALARAYENLRLFGKAEEQYEALRKAHPNDVRALNGLAGLHLRRGENSKALELYNKALEIDPEDADARLGAGLLYHVVGDYQRQRGDNARASACYEKSIVELEAAVEKRPDSVPTRAALGLVYARVRRFQEALAQLRTAANIRRGDPLVHLNLGKVYREMGDSQKARQEFLRTREIDPHGPWGKQATAELRTMKEK